LVDDDHLRVGGAQAHLDRRRRERGEQRHVNRAAAPDSQHGGHKIGRLAHQRRNSVARPDAKLGEGGREPLRTVAELTVGHVARGQVGLDDPHRDPVGRMVIAEDSREAHIWSLEAG
jgi:hypothetical protein